MMRIYIYIETSGDFNTRSLEILGVAWSPTPPLTELHQVSFLDAVVASEVKQRVVEHATMSGRQKETISVKPVRVLGVVLHHFVE